MTKKKLEERYLYFDNWPTKTVEEIILHKMAMDFWTIVTAEELLSDITVPKRAEKIGWSYYRYRYMRSKCMELKDGKWQIKTTNCGG